MLREIESAIRNFWKLSPTGPPEDFVGPRVLLIIFDLNYAKKMWDGISAVDFNKMYKVEEDANTRENEENFLRKRPHNLKCSRLRFSMRTRNYWNLLPIEIRQLEYHIFKKEAKKFIVENQERFLNFGDKDKTHPKFLPKWKPYVPPKPPKKAEVPTQRTSKVKDKPKGKPIVKLENWWKAKKREKEQEKDP